MLEPINVTLHEFEEHPKIVPGALYLYNSLNKIDLSDAFLNGVRQAGHCGLLHLGDEYFRASETDYLAFDYVVRMFPFRRLMGDGMFGLPLGLSNNMGGSRSLFASERTHAWMFAGDWKADRGAMARHFRHVPDGYLSLPKSVYGERGVSRDAYLSNMADAVFAPCPAGNVCVETCRPYEALELGTIPLLPSRRFSNAFEDVLGSHPLPMFPNWSQAAQFVREKIDNPTELDALQSLCQEWWESFQYSTSAELAEFIEDGRNGAYRHALQAHLSNTHVSLLERAMSLLAQQNSSQISERGRFNATKLLRALSGKGRAKGTWSINAANANGAPDRKELSKTLNLPPKNSSRPGQ